MTKLSIESANWHYEKLLAIHNFKYLTLAQKVSIFYHDLEHDLLREITGKKEFFEQFNWLKDNQIRVDRNIKTGVISKVNISDIDNLRNWRHEGIHENNMPEPKYRSHFHTMAQTINFFSELPWSIEIDNIINNRPNVIYKHDNKFKNKKTARNKNVLGKKETVNIINRKHSLKINNSNSAYSSINASVSQWSFNIDNSKFENDFYIILEDQDNKIIYYFYLEKGTINSPVRIFNQRNDNRVTNASIIIIPTNDKNFTNNFNNNPFQFSKYLKDEFKY